jgi:hypothetical protein
MGLRPTNRDENYASALEGGLLAGAGLEPPLLWRPPLQWVFDGARVLQDPPRPHLTGDKCRPDVEKKLLNRAPVLRQSSLAENGRPRLGR